MHINPQTLFSAFPAIISHLVLALTSIAPKYFAYNVMRCPVSHSLSCSYFQLLFLSVAIALRAILFTSFILVPTLRVQVQFHQMYCASTCISMYRNGLCWLHCSVTALLSGARCVCMCTCMRTEWATLFNVNACIPTLSVYACVQVQAHNNQCNERNPRFYTRT